jgi:ABC-type nitrate/sulfonate/bicarbonate transport system substrate-binding protein
MDHVKVIMGRQLGGANTFIAEAEGFFKAQNIEIEFVEVNSTNDADALALLLKGDVDVMQAGPAPALFNTVARGEQIKAVATSIYNDPEACPYNAFVVTEGRAKTFSSKDLKGAHVAVSNGIAQYYFDKLLAKYELTAKDVIIENLPSSARAEALTNNAVVLAWMNEPLLSQSIQKLKFEVLAKANELIPDASIGVLLFGPNMLNRTDDLPVRYLTAYLQGIQQFKQGPTPRNVEIVSKALKIEPDTLATGCWISMRDSGEIDSESTFVDHQTWLDKQGQLDKIVDVKDIYDPSYVQKAYEKLLEMMATPSAEATTDGTQQP